MVLCQIYNVMKNIMNFPIFTLLVAGAISNANATFVDGDISFDGGVILDSPVLENVTQAISWDSVTIDNTSGDFAAAGISDGDPATFGPGWVFGSGQASLWTIGGFTLDLASSNILLQSQTFLIVLGTGTITGNGFDPTPASFSFTTQENDVDGRFSFSGSATAIPEPSSALLASTALLGFGLRRRKIN